MEQQVNEEVSVPDVVTIGVLNHLLTEMDRAQKALTGHNDEWAKVINDIMYYFKDVIEVIE